MTDRLKGCTVTFDRDIREDDVEPLLDAIRMMRGVLSVTGKVTDLSDYMARERATWELRDKILDVLHPPSEKKK